MVRFGCASSATLLVVLVAVVAWAAGSARASRADFVGAERCGSCHPAALRSWQASAHARASESLGRLVSSRRCLGCHSTGDAPAGRPYFSGVQCEACHGAGAGYAAEDLMRDPPLAADLGLRELADPAARAALCARCHRASTRLVPFDPEAAWQRIRH